LGVCVPESHHFEIPDENMATYFAKISPQMAAANLKIPVIQRDLGPIYSRFKTTV
jgi:hypothetical protein